MNRIQSSWKNVILAAVLLGIVTGIVMLVPAFEGTAVREIGIGYEMWIIFAVILVLGCENTIEAGSKCFVFFLISQPLVYIVQQPFNDINLLATYYLPWFIKTLMTFPGGMIAFQIKRGDRVGTLILSLAGGALAGFGLLNVTGLSGHTGVSYLIYGIFCIGCGIGFAFILPAGKKLRLMYIVIISILALTLCGYALYLLNSGGEYDYALGEGTWSVEEIKMVNMDATIENDNLLHIEYSAENANGTVEVENSSGQKSILDIEIVNGYVEVKK